MDDNERSGYVLLAKNDADDANEAINRLDKDDTDEQVRRSMQVASTLALVSIARSLTVIADQGEILIRAEPQPIPNHAHVVGDLHRTVGPPIDDKVMDRAAVTRLESQIPGLDTTSEGGTR